MKRVRSEERLPEPLHVSLDGDIGAEIESLEQDLMGEGYEPHLYQTSFIAGPMDSYQQVISELEDKAVLSLVVLGLDEEDNRREEIVTLDYEVEEGDFSHYGQKIESAINGLGYDVDYWHITAVEIGGSRENVVELAENISLQAEAVSDIGLQENVYIGWMYRASMDHDMEFGYKIFPEREDTELDSDNVGGSVRKILERMAGEREEERNEHGLSEKEIDTLRKFEEALYQYEVL